VQSGTAALGFQGNEFGQTIVANNGGNTLDGGLGNDILTGLGGVDLFAFRSALGPNNIDTITDFVVGVDKIGLDQNIFQLDASFGLGQRFNNQGVAQDADDRIIYNQATGQLFYDADGNGAGAMVQFAVVSGAPPLGSADFMIF
jgi:Ca2+-binding RTX toxin-like protein